MQRRFRDSKAKANSRATPKVLRYMLLAAVAVVLMYVVADLFWPVHRNLRRFDPSEMGRLETTMWRSYYDRKPVKLFFALAAMLRTQYQFPWLRSYLGAFYAAKAAFVFKNGQQRGDYELALPGLESYFGVIRRTGNIDFDVTQAARLELEWWIVHREREHGSKERLNRACAEAAAVLYQISPDSTLPHGRLRAEAMVLRDDRAAAGGVREKDWAQIDSLLQRCYQSLRRVIE